MQTNSPAIATSLSDLIEALKGEVLTDSFSLGMYATDASIYQIFPLAVVLPKDESDVKKALEWANSNQVTILPRGGGTSLAGQTVGNSLVLDFSKYMDQTLEINTEERWVRVQPGKVRDVLNDELAPLGLHFAVDPATSSRANVGGMVGNNSSGTKSILYGKTVDHVLEAKVLLADGTGMHLKNTDAETYRQIALKDSREGEIYRRFKEIINKNSALIEQKFPKVMRRVGGYNLDEFIHTEDWNLAKLITGSEGTLATTLELKLNLEPLPSFKSVCVLHFAELLDAVGAVTSILPYQPSAVEILDKIVVDLSRENLTTKRHCHFIQGDPAAILIVEFYGETLSDVMDRPTQMIKELQEKGLGYAFPLFPQGPEYEDVWVVRKKGLGLMLGIKGKKKPLPFIEDAGIPTQHLREYIDRTLQICKKHQTEVAMYAHVSVGVIHVRPILDLRDQADIERLEAIAEDTFQLVMEYGGSWSGEHGDGLVRSPFNERFFGTELYQAMIQVKRLFDPENRMNPGKIVEAEPMSRNLRYGNRYQDQAVEPVFHYRSEQSFQESVHMCTGVGECRKLLGGTMCPSFKATRDEEHTTRGRANALRMAMSGQLDEKGLRSERLQETLSLCLSCKACKSECPSNVDMAKMKSDVMQWYYDANGASLRDKMIRDAAGMARRFSGKLAKPINFLQSSRLFRKSLEKIAGFDSRRTLPAYASESFSNWFAKNGGKQKKTGKKVALFADTYLNYHEPSIGKAAVKLLNDCGYEVVLANVGCCQRPKISHGFLRDAKTEGKPTVEKLLAFIDQGLPVLVCEPSCASALNDDFPDLFDEKEVADKLTKNVLMIDVFLAREMERGNLNVRFRSKGKGLQIHGHCHQKALYGTQAMKKTLGEPASCTEIPSGCCGMAGSFGYEKEHYALSQKIGAEVLFPAIQNAPEGSELVASGFSCRHQIDHFTGKQAKHWVECVEVIPE
ncbi:FAD/FMN-containing dehydrogenase [Cyclobacterium xiamenense]|uniref:FAD/FMN-containing dehydrogenase n=1 Tax=Cyclobacterium xiamenense TaxID=1297121 RepID=A0A1H6UYF3_9BACT|nr:FAD-binding and (Fe-S)-binding domain-containing protein [Cyclobacterium xiamenense]SEI93012.1 FAD/FMN-containing dehydrogenase [Cyclobacterium xiamenense]